jgi:diguanylate cyclase (GGDEF)-like protein
VPGINDRFEAERLDALRRADLLDTAPEPEFDELVQIAAAICGKSMSIVSLLDEKRQWFKAAVGMPFRETERDIAFCDHTIRQHNVLTVEDATLDPRFRDNPLVTAENGLRFYAGFPVHSPDGFPLGTLCVLDNKPGTINEAQRAALETLARQVNARIELRMQRRELQQALAAAEGARQKLAAADRRFNTFMNNGPFVAFLKDSQSRYLSYNQAFANLFQISLTEWLGKSDEEVSSSEFAKVWRANDLKVIQEQKTVVVLEQTPNSQGGICTWRSYKFPCPADDGSTWVGGFALDVTEERKRDTAIRQYQSELEAANRRLQELAATDPLTGLPNRRIFDERLQFEFSRSRRKKLDLAVLMIDVDDFKQRNDTYGHDHGDQVLVQLAGVFRRIVRESDLAARYGGEEFVVLLPEANEAQALGMAERIMAGLAAERWPYEPVRVSIGAAALDEATPNPQRLVILADEALYVAKRAGKNRATGYHAYYEQMIAQLKAEAITRD